jgi:hypothetical protein
MKRFWLWLCTDPTDANGQPVDKATILASIKFPYCQVGLGDKIIARTNLAHCFSAYPAEELVPTFP